MTSTSTRRELTRGQATVLTLAALPMVAVGIAGGIGTYSNVVTQFGRAATAVGVVAAGEGVTLVLALVMLILTMFGQSAPAPVRAGLWATPVAAAVMGVAVANTPTERIVYGLTPMAMCGAAEGLGLLARRVVIYRTGVDAEADRRNAETVQQLAYHQALAARHPDEGVRADAERKSWKLVGQVGVGDQRLAEGLVEVQRERLRQGADAALSGMLAIEAAPSVVEPTTQARPVTATEALRREFAGMDPADAIRLAHDARPDAPPAELASLLVSYGVVVDTVQVALVLGSRPPEYEVQRGDAADAPQVNALEPVNMQGAVEEAASILGSDAKAREIAEHIARHRRLVVDEAYIRAALSRASKKQRKPIGDDEMREGYA
ncbi:conjugal transfer protein [Streptomyces sp. NPDC042207]|uniref:conjugal transfer protein n=1 Tax=Streptomyces sp. NPDC042207 TaxID=3154331 RepID=UPI0033D8CD96